MVVAGPVLAWVLASTLGGPPTARARPVERVVNDGAGRLVVEWAPEGCERVDPVSSDVVVDVRDVVVTVRALPADEDGACPVDTRTAWTVVLDDPLGDRTVRDGGCLAPGRRATEEQCADGAPTVPVVAPGSTG